MAQTAAKSQCDCGGHNSQILQSIMAGSLTYSAEHGEVAQAQKIAQNPKILAIKCCDSRSLFEALMGKSQVGYIFQLTSLGACTEAVKGQMGYPLRHLKSIEAIVVMGHGDCGAVKSITFGHEEPDETGKQLDMLDDACNAGQMLPVFNDWDNLQVNTFRMCIGNVLEVKKFAKQNGVNLPVIGCVDDTMNAFGMGSMVHYITIDGETDMAKLKQHQMLANISTEQMALWTTWRS